MISNPPQSEPTTVEKLRGLRWNTAAESANTVFVQFTFFGSVFILFLNELGLSKGQIGFMLSLFPFCGLVAPFIAPAVARFGYKRTFVTFWGIRKGITALLLLVPLVVARFGSGGSTLFVGVIIAGFALARAIAETGKYPWMQEYVPNEVRGKYTAVSNVFNTITGLIAVAVAGVVLERVVGLQGYMLLLGIGVIFGLLGFWAYFYIPGGAPTVVSTEKQERNLREAFADSNFRNYLIGFALVTLAITPMTSFLPLFMEEQIGLSESEVVLLQNGVLIGGLISVYVWGWAADRFGSTPVMLSGIICRLFLPVAWLLMPRFSEWSLEVALAIAFLQGLAGMGWLIGSGRLLFVSIVPPEKKTDYMALYYAWIGVVGGISQLLGGWLLELARNLSGQFFFLTLDPYTPLFLLGLGFPLLSLIALRRVRVADEVRVTEFAAMLFRGNPLLAIESMIRYHLARDEQAAVLSTEKLGQSKSLLSLEELLASLDDPRFNVRFEAIVAVGRQRPDERLIQALSTILHGRDPALSVMAAWALGRLGSELGLPPLREALDSGYRSIRAHSARSLATLGDETVIERLRGRLEREQEHGLRVAYGVALGQLQDVASTPLLLALLREEEEPTARAELALALARLAGQETAYISLLRQVGGDLNTAVSRIVLTLDKKWPAASDLIHECATAFSLGQHEQAIKQLVLLIQAALVLPSPEPVTLILQACADQLPAVGIERQEYLLLALHLLAI